MQKGRVATLPEMARQQDIKHTKYVFCLNKDLHCHHRACDEDEDIDEIPDSFNGCFGLYDELGVNAGNLECMDCHLRTACMAMSGGAAC